MLFALIVLLSAILRLIYLSAIEFKVDEAVNLFLSSRVLFGHPFPPGATVSSFGILNPPLFLYILFPFVLISTNPMFVTGAIAVINSFAVGFYFLVIKKYFGKLIAIFSSLLLATSPWAIIFSRKIWAQDLVLPLCVALLFCVLKVLIDKKGKYWLGIFAFTLFLLQIHQATLFFLAPLIFFLILKNGIKKIKYMLLGILLGIVPTIPYFIFEISHQFKDLFFILNAGNRTSAIHDFLVFVRPFQILNQGNFRYLLGDDIQYFAANFPLIYKSRLIFYLEYALLIPGVFWFAKLYPKLRIFIYSIVISQLLFYILKIPSDMHYFIILLPFLFVFLGFAFSDLWRRRITLKIICLVLFTSFFVVSITFITSFLNFAQSHGHLNGDYGTIFAVNQKISQNALKGYEKLPEYKEILLAKYIPLDFMQGTNTITQMLYDNSQTKKTLPKLDKRLQAVPVDYRIYHELLSYYTTNLPDRQTLATLHKKAISIPLYGQIYSVSYNNFLSANFVKSYDSTNFGFAFEYPRHWEDPQEDLNGINILGNGYKFSFVELDLPCTGLTCGQQLAVKNPSFTANSITALDTTISEVVCRDDKNNWCGSVYGPIMINQKNILLIIRPGVSTTQPEKSLVSQMINSLRGI